VLDDFNRPNGPVGGQWPVNTASDAFSIENQRLVKNTESIVPQAMLWPEHFNADQEAFVTLSDVDFTFKEMQLTLKAQNPSTSCLSISVLYSPSTGMVHVFTCRNGPNGDDWIDHGKKQLTYLPGDRLGGRARANGQVEVYKNDELVAEYSVASWEFASQGGYIGISGDIAGMVKSFDDFGGGTLGCN
jgi:hypothetical protein